MRTAPAKWATGLLLALLCSAAAWAAQNACLAEKTARSMIGLAFTSG
jgi:hypothetical protein